MKVDDRVILISKDYFQDESNPYYEIYKVVGTINRIDNKSRFPLKVLWDNDRTNCYKDGDLKKRHLLGDLIDFVNETLTI